MLIKHLPNWNSLIIWSHCQFILTFQHHYTRYLFTMFPLYLCLLYFLALKIKDLKSTILISHCNTLIVRQITELRYAIIQTIFQVDLWSHLQILIKYLKRPNNERIIWQSEQISICLCTIIRLQRLPRFWRLLHLNNCRSMCSQCVNSLLTSIKNPQMRILTTSQCEDLLRNNLNWCHCKI